MDYKDYYKILGVPRNADEKQIKSAFRKLARQLHPDVKPGDKASEERFKDAAEAYEVLGDADKRKKYDQFGQAWQHHQQAGASGGFDWGAWQAGGGRPGATYTYSAQDLEELLGASGIGGLGGFSDFFQTLFGGIRGRQATAGQVRHPGAGQGQIPTADIHHPVEVTFAESYSGTKRVINKEGRRLEVSIPAGVDKGSKVRVRGEGHRTVDGRRGDLYLVIGVADDPRFKRSGNDLTVEVDVPLASAMLGGEVLVPTPSGELRLTIPPETQNGKRFRLTGKGMPMLKKPNTNGDLYAVVHVLLPTNLSDDERALFESLRSMRPA